MILKLFFFQAKFTMPRFSVSLRPYRDIQIHVRAICRYVRQTEQNNQLFSRPPPYTCDLHTGLPPKAPVPPSVWQKHAPATRSRRKGSTIRRHRRASSFIREVSRTSRTSVMPCGARKTTSRFAANDAAMAGITFSTGKFFFNIIYMYRYHSPMRRSKSSLIGGRPYSLIS